MACPSCNATSPDDARFCAQCGSRLSTGAAASEAPAPTEREERKVVSALFADVVGSTVLGERMDPEDFTTLVGDAVARMAGAVVELGGTVSGVAGDGFLALFGAPIAHEDDAERAVRAGLEIVERMASYGAQAAQEWGLEGFAVRVGIETGLAVLAPVGGERSVGYTAMGDSLNTAARLQSAAEPGTILVGPRTYSTVASLFDWGEPQGLTLKGKAEQVTAHTVIGERRPARPTGNEPAEPRLVGRERELALATEAIDEVLAGSGGILFVSGDAGIGKSRLMRELRRALEGSADTARWLDGRCASYGEAIPYLPIRGLLHAWLGRADSSEGDVGAKLRDQLGRLFGEGAADVQPYLGALLEVSPTAAEGDVLAALTPEGVQEFTLGAVVRLLERLSQDGPLVVAFDDLHWADASSLTLIERLLGLTADAPLLVVLAARPERDHPVWRLKELVSREFATRSRDVALRPLGGDADRDLLGAMLGDAALPEDLQRRLLDRAEGNPFFLEELVRSLIDRGALERDGGQWRFDHEAAVDLPDTVEKVVLARIDRLSEPCRDVLSAAAVLGRQFELEVLERVVDGNGTVEEALDELERLDLVRRSVRAAQPGYRFKHSLIQEAAYGALLKRRRQELHRRAADAIISMFGPGREEHDSVLARHHGAAGDHRAALECHHRAALAASRIGALDEAGDHFSGALAAGDALGLGPADQVFRELLVRRGELRYNVGDHQGAQADVLRAIEGASETGDAALHVQALITLSSATRLSDWPAAVGQIQEAVRVGAASGDVHLRVVPLSRLAIAHANLGQLDRAREAAERALQLAAGHDNAEGRALAMDALKLVAQQLGDLDELERLCEQLVPLYLASDSPWYLDWALMESAFVPLARCDWDEALRRIDEALRLTRGRGHRLSEALFLDARCWALRSRGDYANALAAGTDAAALAHQVGHGEWGAWTETTLSWVLLELRAAGPAAERLEEALALAERVQASAQAIRSASLLAWARLLLGEPDAARNLADQAEQRLAAVTVPPGHAFLYAAHAYLAVARVRIATGAPERAEILLAPILAAAKRVGWYETVASASLVIGESLAARGQAHEAEALIRAAVELADERALPGVEWEARAAFARLLRHAGREREADGQVARGLVVVERVASALDDDELRVTFLDHARAELQPAHTP